MNIETTIQRKIRSVIDPRQKLKVGDDTTSGGGNRNRSSNYQKFDMFSKNTAPSNSSDPAELQKRLKECLNSQQSNKVCCDCGDPKPTWGSLIMVPEDAKHYSYAQTLCAVCCYACAAAHRSLGTHICRVKSCNLDEWKEQEVVAMEMGGNENVNLIFEATMVFDSCKITARADNAARTNFIREKYEKRNFYDGTKYADIKQRMKPDPTAGFCNNDDNTSLIDTIENSNNFTLMSPRRSQQKVLRRGNMQAASQNSVRSTRSYQSHVSTISNSSGVESIGLDRTFAPAQPRESLTYADLFEPSESNAEDNDSVNDFLGLTQSNNTNNISQEGSHEAPVSPQEDEDEDVDSEDDLFADSATTATDLFGHGTNYPKRPSRNVYDPGTIREDTSESWDPFAAEDEDKGNPSQPVAAPEPPMYASSPSAPAPPIFASSPATSTMSKKSVKSAPPRHGYGGQNEDLWRSPVAKSGARRKIGLSVGGSALVVGGSVRKLGGSTRKMNSQAVRHALDAWLSPTASEKPKIDDISNSPNPKVGTPNSRRPSMRRSTSSPGGEPAKTRSSKHKSERKIRSCSPPPLIDESSHSTADKDQDFEAIQGEVDLFTGFQGFDKQFINVSSGIGGINSPLNKSTQSQKVTGNTLDSFFQSNEVDPTWSPKSFPGPITEKVQHRSSRRRRESSSGASTGSYKSASSAGAPRRKLSRDLRPPLTPGSSGSGKSLRRSSATGSSRTLSSTSTGGISSASPTSIMEMNNNNQKNQKNQNDHSNSGDEDNDWAADFDNHNSNDGDYSKRKSEHNRSSRSERRSSRTSRTPTSSSSPQRSRSFGDGSDTSKSKGLVPVVSSSVHRRSSHRRLSTTGATKTSRSPSRERRVRPNGRRKSSFTDGSPVGERRRSPSTRTSSRRTSRSNSDVQSNHSRPSRSPSRERRRSPSRERRRSPSRERRSSTRRGSSGDGYVPSSHSRPSRSPSRERRSSTRRGSNGDGGSKSRHDRSSRSPSTERRTYRGGRRRPSEHGWQSPMAAEEQEAY